MKLKCYLKNKTHFVKIKPTRKMILKRVAVSSVFLMKVTKMMDVPRVNHSSHTLVNPCPKEPVGICK